ncbi:MAG: hypothetical protein AAGD22_02055 [Verrucomicrobiota bacterium]
MFKAAGERVIGHDVWIAVLAIPHGEKMGTRNESLRKRVVGSLVEGLEEAGVEVLGTGHAWWLCQNGRVAMGIRKREMRGECGLESERGFVRSCGGRPGMDFE